MANDTKQPDPKPTAPDVRTIPVRKLSFRQGEQVSIPGKTAGTNAITATAPTTSEFWTIDYDPRARLYMIAHYSPGADLARKPSGRLNVPESWACWTPA